MFFFDLFYGTVRSYGHSLMTKNVCFFCARVCVFLKNVPNGDEIFALAKSNYTVGGKSRWGTDLLSVFLFVVFSVKINKEYY